MTDNPFDFSRTGELLRATLACAVPMHIALLNNVAPSQIMQIARECGQTIAEKGDVILFKSKKKGETANAFNALARGLACLSFVPGGVRFLGDHYEAQHSRMLSSKDIEEIRLSLSRGLAKHDLAAEFNSTEEAIDKIVR